MSKFILCGKHNIIVTINTNESIEKILKHKWIFFSYVLYLLLTYCAIKIISFLWSNPIFLPFLADKPLISISINIALSLLAIIMYKIMSGIILKQFKANPKKSFIDFLDSKGLKLKYYRFMASMLKLWSAVNIITLILLTFSLLIIAFLHFMTYINFDYLKLNDIILEDKVSTLEQMAGLVFIFIIFLSLILALTMIVARIIFHLMLPLNKLLNIPISFIEEAIKELESFEYNDEWDKRQHCKNKISNLINNALDFVSVEDKMWEIPREFRFQKIMVGGINNKSLRKDLLSRVNGLHRRMNNIAIDLNCMNDENIDNIIYELAECSNIIKNKEICAVKKIDFTETRKIFWIYERINTPIISLMKKL